jgi:serine/threonine protein kinase
LCDFGLARILYYITENIRYTENVITRYINYIYIYYNINILANRSYRPPEILYGSTIYNSTVDIWSIGCIFCELILKVPLWEGKVISFNILYYISFNIL